MAGAVLDSQTSCTVENRSAQRWGRQGDGDKGCREGQRLASGFNSGILFLLGSPFVVVCAIAFLIFRPHLKLALPASPRRSRPTGQKSAAALERPL